VDLAEPVLVPNQDEMRSSTTSPVIPRLVQDLEGTATTHPSDQLAF
jgi:hypothetical protein